MYLTHKFLRVVSSQRALLHSSVRSLNKTNDEMPKTGVWSCNEWDPLEEVVIGRADNAVVPTPYVEVKSCLHTSKWDFFKQHGGKYWIDVIPEHWKKLVQELENFVKAVESEGVKVVRPEVFDFGKVFSNKYISTKGVYNAMPRDILTVIADEVIECPMAWRCRAFEHLAYRKLRDYYVNERGAKWTVVPQPSFGPDLYNENLEADQKKTKERLFATTEHEACFDAADFVRAGRDVFGQRSNVTNKKGIEWMRQHLKPKGITVHEIEFYEARPMHIDSTFNFIKPGYALRNPDRHLKSEDLFIKSGWKFVDVPRPIMPKSHPLYLSSEWLSMNTLMLSPDAVFVEKTETPIQEMYRSVGVRPIPVSIIHMNSIGGGFHCWTCDMRRNGKLEKYFDCE